MTDDPLKSAGSAGILQMLEGVAQLAIEIGLGVGPLHALTEIAFVSAAQKKLSDSGASNPDNAARIAVWSGLYRHIVNDLLDLADAQSARSKPFQNFTVRVMTAWLTAPEYVEADGTPKVLPIRGKSPCFNSLVNFAIKNDVPPKLIREDLQRIHAIQSPAKGHVQLVRYTYGNPVLQVEKITELANAVSLVHRAYLRAILHREPQPTVRYIARSDLPKGTSSIVGRELGRGAQVLFNNQHRAMEHEAARGKGSSTAREQLSAVVAVLTEPAPTGEPIERPQPRPNTSRKRVRPSSRKSRR